MMSSGILRRDQLVELTGAKQLAKQISLLKAEGIPYFFSPPMDYPRTTWEIIHETLKVQLESNRKPTPQDQMYSINIDGLEEAKNAAKEKARKHKSTTLRKKKEKRLLPGAEGNDA